MSEQPNTFAFRNLPAAPVPRITDAGANLALEQLDRIRRELAEATIQTEPVRFRLRLRRSGVMQCATERDEHRSGVDYVGPRELAAIRRRRDRRKDR